VPKISVIIPCYNSVYLAETVNSCLRQKYRSYEIIIVNDGSTLKKTNQVLNKLKNPKIRIINIRNQGVAAARNIGIASARAPYILPLDADYKLGDGYLVSAVKVLDANPNIGIVSCEAEFFGGLSGKWPIPEFSIAGMLLHNMFFCSSVFRKKDWQIVGGYKSELWHGLEDWDFWLSILALPRRTYRIPKTLFYYRIQKISRSKQMLLNKKLGQTYWQIFNNHKLLYFKNILPIICYIGKKIIKK